MDTSPYRILLVLETIFQFHEHLGVLIVDGEATAVGMEEIVAEDGVQLVVESIVGTEAIVNASIGDVDVGEGLQCQCIV